MGIAVVILLLAASIAQAETRLAGVVRSGGLAIPGATVTATRDGQHLSTTTDENGRYELPGLAAGKWKLQVEMVAFAPAQREVTVGDAPLQQDWTLEVKVAARTPALAAAAPAAARASAAGGGNGRPNGGFRNMTVNQTVENEVLSALSTGGQAQPSEEPTNANEAFLVNGTLTNGLQQAQQQDMFAIRRMEMGQQMGGGFAQGAPGMGPGGPGGPGMGPGGPGMGPGGPGMGPGGLGGRGGFGGMGPGGFGGRGGMMGGPRAGAGGPPFGGRNANFGNRAGRGRQQIRGAAFFSLDNSAFDARPFSLTGQTVAKPSYAQSRFGLVGGGPLQIPKLFHSSRTFFFFNYFGTRSRSPYNAVSTLPTLEERSGDFSQRGTPIFDPTNGLAFPGNRIPASRLDSVAVGLLPFIPKPNQPGLVQNYQYVTSSANNSDNLGGRVNHTLSQHDRLDFNLNYQRRNGVNPQLFGFLESGDGYGASLNANWTHNLTSRTINTVRFNFSRNRNETLPFFAYGPDVAGVLGIQGVSRDPVNFGPPNLSFTNFGALTDASPLLQRNQTVSVGDGVTLVRGAHTIGLGGEMRRLQLNTRTDQNARGTFVFSGLVTSAFNAQGQPVVNTGLDFADFLLGRPQSSSIRFGDSSTYFRASAFSGYGLDDWRVRPNLTVNLGLRYEYFTPYHEKYNHIANLDVAPGFTGVAVVTPDQAGPYTGVFPAGLVDPDKNNFSPRAGIAWRPFPKKQLQIRAGYGVFFNGSIYNQFPARLAAQPPFANTATVNTSILNVLTLENGFATAPAQTITNTYAVARDYRVGYAQTWNFSIQQSLPQSLVVEVGYLGTKGTNLDIQRLPNRAAPGSTLTAEQRRQIGNAVGFTFDDSSGNSIYHAAQVRVMRRFSKGISANALYTFSKSIDNASTLGGGAAVVAQNDLDLHAERGLSTFDQRHTLNLFYVLTSPVSDTGGRLHSSGLSGHLLKDWTLSGGVTFGSGLPFTARVLGNQSDTAGTGSVGSGRADATGAPVDLGTGFFNTAAFAVPLVGYGNAARNTIPGPARVSLNLSFGRSFRLDERRRLEVRGDAQNFTNHVSFTGLGTVLNAVNYGLATAAAPMRTVTLTARLRF